MIQLFGFTRMRGSTLALSGLIACISLFGDIRFARAESWTLERAIQKAIAESPDSNLAQEQIAAAEAALEQANSAFYPQLQVSSAYQRTDNPVSVFGMALNQKAFSPSLDFNNVPSADNLNVKGALSLMLFNGGRSQAAHASAISLREAASSSAQALHKELAFEVARGFFSVLKTRDFIRASDAAVRSYEKSLTNARSRFNAGTALETEVLDVEVHLAQAQEQLIRSRNANALAERALRNLIGVDDGSFSVADSAPELEVPNENQAKERQELLSVQALKDSAQAQVRQAQGGFLPRVTAFASVDYDRGWKFDGDATSYGGGVMAEWKIFNGFKTAGEVGQAQALRAAVAEQERKLKLAIALEREQAQLNLKEAEERLTVTGKAVDRAQRSAELTRVRFQQGLALATQLVDAETALTTALVHQAEANADRRVAIAALRKSYGLETLN